MKRLAFCAFWLFIFCSPSIGQVNTGPKVITRNLRQDKKGNIWIAAYDGVFRYDGKSFTNLTSKLSPARYFSLLEDQKGNFWFSTVGSGIYYYDGNAFTNFTTTDGLVHNTVTEIYQDRAGNTWFSTLRGLSRYDGKSFKNYLPDEAHPEGDNNDINYILEDKTGKFWIATRGNAYTFDGSTFTILPILPRILLVISLKIKKETSGQAPKVEPLIVGGCYPGMMKTQYQGISRG